MRVKANNKIYDVLEYTNNKKEIEDFMGEDTVVHYEGDNDTYSQIR